MQCNIHYAQREDAELAVDKLAYLRTVELEEIVFEDITPDSRNHWLNQSNSDFEKLMPLANRQTKLAKTIEDEQAVFGLYSLGVITSRDGWVYDFDERRLTEKVAFFCATYAMEMKRLDLEPPGPTPVRDWVDRSIKWTSELESHLGVGELHRLQADKRHF